jgi:hypothetical protein
MKKTDGSQSTKRFKNLGANFVVWAKIGSISTDKILPIYVSL